MMGTEFKKSSVIDLQELLKIHEKEPAIPFLWNGIKQGSFGYIFGPAKSGKTILCENLGLSIASQAEEFFGHKLMPGENPVLFISLEEHWRHRAERNKNQLQQLSWSPEKKLDYKVVDDEFPRFFATNDDWETLKDTISESSANVVFIDSLTRLVDGEIEKSTHCRGTSQKLRDIAHNLDITLIVIHHTPKQSGHPLTVDSLAGSRVLAQEADFLIGVNKVSSNTRYLKEVAFRYKQENDDYVTTFSISDNLWIEPNSNVSEQQLLKESDGRYSSSNYDIVCGIANRKSKENNGIVSSVECESEATEQMSRSTFRDHWKKMVNDGYLVQMKKGEYKITST